MNKPTPIRPPEPVDQWLPGLSLEAAALQTRGTVAFDGSGEPWSKARRFDGGVQLQWSDAHFEITSNLVVVDAKDPRTAADLNWNTIIATVLELRGVTCLHGFMVEAPNGEGLAVLGNSGAGKTTTGRALLELGCTLVCDDLVTLTPGSPPTGRPFLRRLPEQSEDAKLDVGGKIREPQPLVSTIPPITRALILDAEAGPVSKLDSMQALDHLLRNPYVPFDITPDSTKRRLAALVTLVSETEVLAATPRSQTPDEFAELLLTGI